MSTRKSPRADDRGDDSSDNGHSHPTLHATQPNKKQGQKPKDKPLNQMIAAFAKNNLRDDKNDQSKDGVRKTRSKKPRNGRKAKQIAKKTKQLTAALEGFSLSRRLNITTGGQQKGKTSTTPSFDDSCLLEDGKLKVTNRTTRSMNGMLPLRFDNSFLQEMGGTPQFMNNDEIRTWIDSVSHHLKSWYRECLCDPANEAKLQVARRDPMGFANTVAEHESMEPGPRSTRITEVSKERVASNLVQQTAIVSRRIETDGQRGGAFLRCTDPQTLNRAAVMLLVSMIMDLAVNMGYFIKLFVGIDDANLTAQDELIILALRSASTGTAPPLQHPREISAAPRTLQVPGNLFETVSGTLENLSQSSGCRFLVHPPSALNTARHIVLVGSVNQMDEAEQIITRVIETSATLSSMDMS